MPKNNPQDDPRPRIATLGSYQTNNHSDSDDNEGQSDNIEPQNFFVGGGKNSGLVVEDPTANDMIHRIMERAREGGAMESRGDNASSSHTSSGPFSGQGFSLAGTHAFSNNNSEAGPPNEEDEDVAIREVTFWRNGFSIDDEPLRNYSDPANQRLLKAILSGHAPLQELNVKFNQPVELRIAHRASEDYMPPPKKPMKPFEGAGQRLGAVASHSGSRTSTPPPPPQQQQQQQNATIVTPSKEPIQLSSLDRNAPMTQIQIRLSNGQRLIGNFNLTQTVGDIRQYIQQNDTSDTCRQPFILQTTLPVTILDDDLATIASAGLAHSTLVHRLL